MKYQKPTYQFLEQLIELKSKFKKWDSWSISIQNDKENIQSELEDLLERLNSLYDLIPLVRFELSSINSSAVGKSFYHETEVIFDSISYPYLNEWEFEDDPELHKLFLANVSLFNSLMAVLDSDSGWNSFMRNLARVKTIKNHPEEEESNPSTQLSRKGTYLLFHFFGLFQKMDEELDYPGIGTKSKIIRSFAPSTNKHEGRYTQPTAILVDGHLMTKDTINEVRILSIELKLPKLEEWAIQLLEKIDKD